MFVKDAPRSYCPRTFSFESAGLAAASNQSGSPLDPERFPVVEHGERQVHPVEELTRRCGCLRWSSPAPPAGRQTVNLGTWMWLDAAMPAEVSVRAMATATGVWSQVTATPQRLGLDPGTSKRCKLVGGCDSRC